MSHLTVCRATETAFETHSATINSLHFNKLCSVSAFTPIFSPGGRETRKFCRQDFLSAFETATRYQAATLDPLYSCGW